YARAHPGKINFGSAGAGSITHLAVELLKRETGIDLVHVPYRGVGPAVGDMLGGHIQLIVSDGPFLLPPLRSGAIKAPAGGSAGGGRPGTARRSSDRGARLCSRQFRQLVRAGGARAYAGGRPRHAAQGERRGADIRRTEKAVREQECHAFADDPR